MDVYELSYWRVPLAEADGTCGVGVGWLVVDGGALHQVMVDVAEERG